MKALMLLIFLLPISAFASWPQIYVRGMGGGVTIDSYDNVIIVGSAHIDSLLTAHTIKYDSSGGIIWSRDFEAGTIYGGGAGVVCDKSNNIIIGGCVYSAESHYAYCTLKYSSEGTLLWSRIYRVDSLDLEAENDIAVDKNNNVIVTGESGLGYCTIKYDSMGTELWRKYFPMGNKWSGPFLTIDIHNNVMISLNYLNKSLIVKYSHNGDSLWTKQFDDSITGPLVMDKNNNIVIGSTLQQNDTSYIVSITKVDSMGTTISRKEYASDQAGTPYDITIDNDGNIITAGVARIDTNNGDYSGDFGITKYTPGGDSILWNRTYHKENFEWGKAVAVNSKNEIFVTGTIGLGDTIMAWFTLKYDSDGNLIGISEEQSAPKKLNHITVFPNPFTSKTTLRYSIPRSSKVSLNIYDISGSCVKTFVNGEKPAGSYTTTLNANELKTGVYFVRLTAGTFKETKKLVLMR
ncbi:MAG: T9SS type A sorting domain-containing protein [bacterium]